MIEAIAGDGVSYVSLLLKIVLPVLSFMLTKNRMRGTVADLCIPTLSTENSTQYSSHFSPSDFRSNYTN